MNIDILNNVFHFLSGTLLPPFIAFFYDSDFDFDFDFEFELGRSLAWLLRLPLIVPHLVD